MLASGLIEVLFSWLNHVFSWLVSLGMAGKLEWLSAYWPLLVLIIGLVCFAVDLAVWLLRYRGEGLREWTNTGIIGLLVRGIRQLRSFINQKRGLAEKPAKELVNHKISPSSSVKAANSPPPIKAAKPRVQQPQAEAATKPRASEPAIDVMLLTDMPPKPRQAPVRPRPAQNNDHAPTRPLGPVITKEPDDPQTRQ